MLAFDNPVRRSFVNEMVPVEDLPNAVTLYSAMVSISRVAGPAIAGVLVVTVGYGWAFTVDLAVVAGIVVGATAIAYLTATQALAQIRTEPHMIGRVLALQTVLVAGTTPIGGPILGVLSDTVGARAPVVVGGVAALLAVAFGFLAVRRAQTRPGASGGTGHARPSQR